MKTSLIRGALNGDEAALTELLARLNTIPLQIADVPTRVLLVLNPGLTPYSGTAVLPASFRIKVQTQPPPVTVWLPTGEEVTPSRLMNETLSETGEDGRRLWSFELQFLVKSVPARGGIAYPATYGQSPDFNAFWDNFAGEAHPLRAFETDIHPGDIDLPFRLPAI